MLGWAPKTIVYEPKPVLSAGPAICTSRGFVYDYTSIKCAEPGFVKERWGFPDGVAGHNEHRLLSGAFFIELEAI